LSSSISTPLGRSFKIIYADVSDATEAVGELYNDTVKIGGLTATKQTLGAVTDFPAGPDITAVMGK